MSAAETRDDVRCAACGATRMRQFAQSMDVMYRTSDLYFQFLQCANCRTISQKAIESGPSIPARYPSQYEPHYISEINSGIGIAVQSLLRRIHARIAALFPWHLKLDRFFSTMTSSTIFLDYGSGQGNALDRAKRHGAVTIGIDFIPSVVKTLRAREHLAFLPDEDWRAEVLAHGGATHLQLGHVLEHVLSPSDLLDELISICRPGAIIHIAGPSPSGISAMFFRASWYGLEVPRHLHILSARAIADILHARGITILANVGELTAKDFVRSFAITLWRRKFIKRIETASSMDKNGIALVLVLPLLIIAYMIGMSDRFHIFAKKD